MSIENELKLMPREKIKSEDILSLLKKKGYNVEQALKPSNQEDTYYDDPNRTLLKNGCSFRIRRKVGKTVVTYKSPIDSDKDYKQREELETEIPEMYVQEDGSIHIEDAIDVLRKKYPDVNIPKDLQFAVKVINNRNKVNVHTEDGTVIELAFDHLHTENERRQDFSMKDEMECEVLSGNPEHLSELHRIISENYDVQINDLSKYARAMKEMQEQRDNMSLEETTVCAMLSYMIRSKEFEQLSYKGQVLHDYRVKIPENLSLENFKDPEYLIERISKVKRTKNYRPGKITSLEDMFLCFFSDMDYRDIEYKLVNFLNDNYYRGNTPITNRMLHSQQVMLITGLINKSKEITENDKKPLLCLTSALIHDIGHVPGAHTTERILGDLDGFFSHEINGRNVIERIVTDETANIIEAVKKHMASLGKECSAEQIREYIQINKTYAIESYDISNIPQYSGNFYVVLNDNKPNFTDEDYLKGSFEEYSELDALGRCGVAYANVGLDTMPTEERGSIGMIKPSGWHTVKYDIVSGKYLYNRCHLIGYQLTGENANEKNLITCTRQTNVGAMLDFENEVAEYIKNTNNHVLYRATPIYENTNLLASGIQLEASSVEDRCKDICFNVYIYNVQDGITIDYTNGDSHLSE